MKSIRRQLLASACIGAAAFWLPSMVLHGIWPGGGTGFHARVSTVVLPITTVLVFVLIVFGKRIALPPPGVAFSMLVGIWLFGSGPIVVNATLSGGGFHQGIASGVLAIMMGILPPYLFIMSTYDGTLGGLILGSIALSVAWLPFRGEVSLVAKP